jgi:hypothetical protein
MHFGGRELVCRANKASFRKFSFESNYALEMDSLFLIADSILQDTPYVVAKEQLAGGGRRYRVVTEQDFFKEKVEKVRVVDSLTGKARDSLVVKVDTLKVPTGQFSLLFAPLVTPLGSGTKVTFSLGEVRGCETSADYDYNAKKPLVDFYWKLRNALLGR